MPNKTNLNLLLAKNCQNMTEVRRQVDLIDEELVKLLAIRQTYMNAAARIKQCKSLVRDEARIEDVVSKVLSHSSQYGLSANISEPLWRLLIEKSIEFEHQEFDKLKSQG